jgi:predicted amidohydrolase
MSEEISFSQPWHAAVVQAPLYNVTSDATARETQRQNARRIAEHIDRIIQTYDPAPRLIVYPALSLNGSYRHVVGVAMETAAIELPGEQLQPILDACRRNNCYFVSSTQERHSKLPGRFFHTGYMLGPEGLVLRSPKAQAFSAPETTALHDMFDEYESAIGPGSVLPVAKTELGIFGCLVEAEMYVPETVRVLRSKGAEIVVHPTGERGEIGRVDPAAFKQTAALANGVYWLSANRSRVLQRDADFEYMGGNSAIIGPDGHVDAMAGGHGDGVIVGRIDPERIRESREKYARWVKPDAILYRDLYR